MEQIVSCPGWSNLQTFLNLFVQSTSGLNKRRLPGSCSATGEYLFPGVVMNRNFPIFLFDDLPKENTLVLFSFPFRFKQLPFVRTNQMAECRFSLPAIVENCSCLFY